MDGCIRVIIAEAQRMVGEALAFVLEHEKDNHIVVAGLATDSEKCIDLIEEVGSDIIIIAFHLTCNDGENLIKYCKDAGKLDQIVILTDDTSRDYFNLAVLKKITGYVLKTSKIKELIYVIKSVYNGESYFDKNLIHMMAKSDKENEGDTRVNIEEILTKREIEVLKLLTSGLFNKEIAYKLSISEKTVKNHISNIFKKTGVSDRTQAAVYAIKNGLVSV